ncbi:MULTISPECIES: complex I NDUFA9 subunit family protein [Halobacterium]|uniref:complex I NDUFA9 subunit family protein n=1 Tax=Halobacterium TaxID=2239 RepID=UPI0019662917|nr:MULTISPECIES: complex I NDUFA9 subunit family protein [Halobacterium]MCF2237539.1 complex I NDUFA9 subunit family protein [Halobacterium salinarum]QRY22175.1 complex I NDUFA9 subunit family protein [Halobacterium sp. GSL-19]WJK63552.1 complex I NDUFA9 subunit family protein [Halobacterium salinarum]
MDVLVTGGTGFIGTHLCRELDDRGHDVTAFAREPADAALPADVTRIVGDVTVKETVANAIDGHDAVVNLVALSPLFKPSGGDSRHLDVHLGGTENVVAAASEAGVEYVLQLSALDADPTGPTAYLRAKGRAEEAVRSSDLHYTIVRPSVVFGDGGEFVPFTKQLTTPYVTGLPGGGASKFQPIWVGDLVPMLADALGTEAHWGETYDIGGPDVLTLADVTRMAYRAAGKSVRVLPVPMPLAAVGLTLADPLPFVPMGADQYRSLKLDNTTSANDVTAFDVDPSTLRTLAAYLGVE